MMSHRQGNIRGLLEFVINHLKNKTDVHDDTVTLLVENAESLKSKKGLEAWMEVVKEKMGRPQYAAMKLDFEESVKQDAGFEEMSENDVSTAFGIFYKIPFALPK